MRRCSSTSLRAMGTSGALVGVALLMSCQPASVAPSPDGDRDGGDTSPAPCVSESDAQVCARLGKNCGTLVAKDLCGVDRTVVSCGLCAASQACSANLCVATNGIIDDAAPYAKANATSYTSYPLCCDDPTADPTECVDYSGCQYKGKFSFVAGQQTREWVQQHNIIAVHQKDGETYKLKTLRLRLDGKLIDAQVLDVCSDTDCNGCCTRNASANGLNFLIDIEKYTRERWGWAGGAAVIEWKCLDCP